MNQDEYTIIMSLDHDVSLGQVKTQKTIMQPSFHIQDAGGCRQVICKVSEFAHVCGAF